MMKLCVLLLLSIVLAQAANHVSAYRKHKCSVKDIYEAKHVIKNVGNCATKDGLAARQSLLSCGKSQAYLQKLCGQKFNFDVGGILTGLGFGIQCTTTKITDLLNSVTKPGSCSSQDGLAALQSLLNCGKSQADLQKLCGPNFHFDFGGILTGFGFPAQCPAAKIDSLMNKIKKLNDCSSAEGKAVRQELINCGKSQEELNSLCHNFWKGVGNFIRNPFGIFGK